MDNFFKLRYILTQTSKRGLYKKRSVIISIAPFIQKVFVSVSEGFGAMCIRKAFNTVDHLTLHKIFPEF